MPAPRSSSLRIELLLLLLACPLLATDCGVRTVWGIPAGELQARLKSGDTAPLLKLDFTKDPAKDALGLEPGAPYYLSLLFDSLDMKPQSLAMLELAARDCPQPWKEEAVLLLLRKLAAGKDWKGVVDAARGFLKSSPKSLKVEEVRRALVEALYWTGAYGDMLEESARLTRPDAEVRLFRSVSLYRAKREGSRELFRSLFMNERIAALHGRAYQFLVAEKDFRDGFTEPERVLFEAMNLLVLGDWNKGVPMMEKAVTEMDPSRIPGTALLWNLGSSYLNAGRTQRGQEVFQDLAGRLSGTARLEALEFLGRLARRNRDAVAARKAFAALIAETRDTDQVDRARWYLLDLAIQDGTTDMASFLAAESPQWKISADFVDLLEGYTASVAGSGNWRAFPALFHALERSGPPRIRAQIAYVTARALTVGLIPTEASAGLSVQGLLEAAIADDAGGYYGILASVVLGRPPQLPGPVTDVGTAPVVPERKPGLDPLSRGFFSFGLASQAFNGLWESRNDLTADALAEAARLMAAGGEFRGSINVAGLLLRKGGMTGRETELLYPRPFSSDIEKHASSLGIPSRVLYALVREESYFDRNIVSSAGAVGLAQLMPETAGDAARKLRITEPDLRNPGMSLALGTRHLQDLLSRLPSLPKALLAYNAGLTRVKGWDARFNGLPADLFVEAVPFAESRGYVRKILTSAAMYAGLYDRVGPREAVGGFYPELLRLPDSH